MLKSTLSLLSFGLLLGIIIFLILLLYPRTYGVSEFVIRPGTQYWELSTGSKIGYTHIPAQSAAKPSPILYLHGGPGGIITDATIESLRPLAIAGYDVYLYDQVGSGHSNRLEDIAAYTPQRHREDLAEIIKQIPSKKVIFIGHSWGAMLATLFLATYPEQVDRMILTGPGPVLPINRSLAKLPPPDSLHLIPPAFSNQQGNEAAHTLRSKCVQRWAWLFQSKLATDQEADAFFTHLNTLLNRSTDCEPSTVQPSAGGGGYYAHLMTANSFQSVPDTRPALRNRETPLLILKGQCDNQAWGFTQEYLDIFPQAQLEIIEGVGHNIASRKPDVFQELILTFLED